MYKLLHVPTIGQAKVLCSLTFPGRPTPCFTQICLYQPVIYRSAWPSFGTAAVESVKDFKAGIVNAQKSLEKTVDKINDMMHAICEAAGIDT